MAQGRGQVRLLTRHFLRRFLDNDLIAPEADLHASVAALVAALSVVAAAVALAFFFKYNPYQAQSLAEKLTLALDDKALLIGGAMIVMALLAVLAWDALALDDRDLAILGPLPIRPAVLLASKIAALGVAVAVATLAINALPAILFPMVVLARAPVGLAYGARWIAAHAFAGAAACVVTCGAVGSLRMALALALPARVSRRLLPAVQFALLLALLTLLLMWPLVATRTRDAIEAGSRAIYFSPPLWFLGLEELLIGRHEPVFVALSRIAGVAAAGVSVVGAAIYLAAFRVHQRRFGACTPAAFRPAARARSALVERVAALVTRDGIGRATFMFTVQTLTRSARHRLCIAGYMGLGLACVAASLLAARFGIVVNRDRLDVTSMAFAAQTNLIFFLLVGVRVAAGFPADLGAAWAFRLRAAPALRRYQAGTRWAFVLVGVVPLLVLLVPLHVALWGWYAAFVHLASGTVLALLLLDVLFRRSDRIPFVAPFAPARTVLSLRLPFYLVGYLVFVYFPPHLERVVVWNPELFVAWAGLFTVVVARFLSSQWLLLRHDRMPAFDEGEDLQTLGLSGWTRNEDGDAESPAVGRSDPAAPTRWLAAAAGAVTPDERPQPPGAVSWAWCAEQTGQQLAFALRRLRSVPGFTLFAVVTLALGIGATTAIYSVIHATVLTPPDIRHIDYVANLYHSKPRDGGRTDIAFSWPDYEDLRRQQTVFSHLAAWTDFTQVMVANGAGEVIAGELVTGDYFAVVGARPRLGRLLQPADDRMDAPAVVVLSHEAWQRRFAGDPAVVGKSVRMNGQVFEVVGVAPASFRGVFMPSLVPTSAWVPLRWGGVVRPWLSAAALADREHRCLLIKGFLKDGRTLADAAAEVATIGRRLDLAYPIGRDIPPRYHWTPSGTRNWVATPAAAFHVHERVDAVVLPFAASVMVAVGLVLLVACSNLANLILARGAARRQALGVRLALGASRSRLVAEQLVESGVIAVMGGVGAAAVACAVMAWLSNVTVPFASGFALHVAPAFNVSVAAVAVASTLVALVVFGLVPAIQLTRTDVRSVLAADGASNSSPRWHGRGSLIAAQVAVSVALLVVATIYAHEVASSARRAAGLDLRRMALVRLDFEMQAYGEQRARETLARVLDVASREAGIEAVALGSGVPATIVTATAPVTTPDRPFREGRDIGTRAQLIAGTPGIFQALGVRLLHGRAFDARDARDGERVVVISERLARELFGTADVVGRSVLMNVYEPVEAASKVRAARILGITAEVSDSDGAVDHAVVYAPFTQQYEPGITVIARARGGQDATAIARRVRDIALRVDPELAILGAGSGAALSGAMYLLPRLVAALAGLLGLVALVLAMAGLYGVLSFVVAGRTREIGIRLALGATRTRLVGRVLADGLRPVLEGIAVGLGLAAVTVVTVRPLVARVLPAIDPLAFTLLPVPFVLAALAACYLPARRASAVDPNVALRQL